MADLFWLVKRGDLYFHGAGWGSRAEAFMMPQSQAYGVAREALETNTGIRVVRVHKKPKRDEAAIRRDERLRIAGAFGERGILVLFNGSAVAEASGLSRTEIGAKVIQRAILAFDWPGK